MRWFLGLHFDAIPPAGQAEYACWTSGPEAFLGWVESQLGLGGPPAHPAARILQLAARLDACSAPLPGSPGLHCSASFAADRWSTARALLRLRDALRLGGWAGDRLGPKAAVPEALEDLQAAEAQPLPLGPGVAERLEAVDRALDAGQVLPPLTLELEDTLAAWPRRWRGLLQRLGARTRELPAAHAPRETGLGTLQESLRGETLVPLDPGPSLLWQSARSRTEAIRAVVAALSTEPDRLPSTAICCEDGALALRLNEALRAARLPMAGARDPSSAQPVQQLLPLFLELAWGPVDPARLLDLLTLPLGPIPRRAAWRLAEALMEQPGLGSAAWERTLQELTAPDSDPEGSLGARLETWLPPPEAEHGEAVPSRSLAERARQVARWAAGRATSLDEAEAAIRSAIMNLAGRAARVAELVESQGARLEQPQLARILEACASRGAAGTPTEAGAVVLLQSLAELSAPVDRLVWLGRSTSSGLRWPWSRVEVAQLHALGIEVDDGSVALCALRAGERRGLSRIRERVQLIEIAEDPPGRPHPLWLRLETAFRAGARRWTAPEPLELALRPARPDQPQGPRPPVEAVAPVAPQGPRPLWPISPELLRDRETSSASSLETRLGCPLKWVLSYGAYIRGGAIANLPSSFLLKGSFCHQVLERVFGEGADPLPSPAEGAARVERCFDARLPLDAAPLALPSAGRARAQLRAELASATRTLLERLAEAGLHIDRLELALDEPIDLAGRGPRRLMGSVDCVARDARGRPAVIDFKYAGNKKYPALIAEGRAVQLAVYARALATREGIPLDHVPVAYLLLSSAQILTPEGSPVPGEAGGRPIPGSPAIAQVWARFAAALEAADSWLDSGEEVPARPLQDPEDWPESAELVMGEPAAPTPCKYCPYPVLCGRTELL